MNYHQFNALASRWLPIHNPTFIELATNFVVPPLQKQTKKSHRFPQRKTKMGLFTAYVLVSLVVKVFFS